MMLATTHTYFDMIYTNVWGLVVRSYMNERAREAVIDLTIWLFDLIVDKMLGKKIKFVIRTTAECNSTIKDEKQMFYY